MRYRYFPFVTKYYLTPFSIELFQQFRTRSIFWQRAYLNKRYRQELIFSLKTTFDDFRHKSTKFRSVFIDFADGFCSINHQFLLETLQYFDIPDICNCFIEDLYKYSSFKVICVSDLSKRFIVVSGTKTGDPLSAHCTKNEAFH